MKRLLRWLERRAAAWHERQHEEPVLLKFHHDLSEEDIQRIRERFAQHYRNRGMRSPL